MINKRVETFLENTNMNYLFCLLSNLEVQRLNSLPSYIKSKFTQKITETALDHVAMNDIPDFIMDIEEAKAEMERLGLTPEEFETGVKVDRYEEEEDFEDGIETDEFQNEYKPVYQEDNYDDDFDEEELTDNDDDE